MPQMTRAGPFSKGRASFRLVAAILYVNNKVLTASFNGRTVESLILRNSLISKSDSFLTTHTTQNSHPRLHPAGTGCARSVLRFRLHPCLRAEVGVPVYRCRHRRRALPDCPQASDD